MEHGVRSFRGWRRRPPKKKALFLSCVMSHHTTRRIRDFRVPNASCPPEIRFARQPSRNRTLSTLRASCVPLPKMGFLLSCAALSLISRSLPPISGKALCVAGNLSMWHREQRSWHREQRSVRSPTELGPARHGARGQRCPASGATEGAAGRGQ